MTDDAGGGDDGGGDGDDAGDGDDDHKFGTGYHTSCCVNAIQFRPSSQTSRHTTLCFKKEFTLLLFSITKSDVDRFQYYLVGM